MSSLHERIDGRVSSCSTSDSTGINDVDFLTIVPPVVSASPRGIDADPGWFTEAKAVRRRARESVVVNHVTSNLHHFAPKAKSCIFLFQAGAPSHLDLFDPKPKLNELHGQPLPADMLEKVRFAFIKKESAVLLGSPRKWSKHGECGMDFSATSCRTSRRVPTTF